MGQVPDLPTTSYALLGLLSFGQELTGYQLKQWADASLRFYWVSPAMSHVYTELKKLQEHGLVASRDEAGGGGRAARTYTITASGRRELERWLDQAPLEFPVLKHPVALRLFLGHVVGHERTARLLEDYVASLGRQRHDLAAVREGLGDDPTFGWPAMVADWGLAYYDFEARIAADMAQRLREGGGTVPSDAPDRPSPERDETRRDP